MSDNYTLIRILAIVAFMIKYIVIFLSIYLALGFVAAYFLSQTPYAENPLWVMILLWPFFFF